MNLLYLSLSYVPSRRASSVQVMKMCQAFARAGAQVTLVTKASRSRQEPGVEDDYRFYGVAPLFEIIKLPRPAVRGGGLIFSMSVRRLLRRRRESVDLVYAREISGALFAARLGLPVILELHTPPSKHSAKALREIVQSKRLLRLVVISRALQELLTQGGWIPHHCEVVWAPDAADVVLQSPEDLNKEEPVGQSPRRPRYGYVGQLYEGKAMELLVPLARIMPNADFHVVGGSREDLARWRQLEPPPNLLLHGFVPPAEVPAWHARCDALLLPSQSEVYGASGKTPIGEIMSPMKLFEYMAAGKPIVSSDLPVLREVLHHGENALLVPPDDAEAWKEALERLAREPSTAQKLSQTAQRDVLTQHTWDARAAKVLAGL